MKKHFHKAALLLLGSTLLLSACEKDDTGSLDSAVPTSDFTTTSRTVGFTTEVTFTATNTDGFLYQWEFDDGTVGSGQQVVHVYSKSGSVKPRLITAYRGGTSVSAQKEIILPAVFDLVKAVLTGGSSRTWILDNTKDAPIVVGPNDGNPTGFFPGSPAGSLPACQADDEFTFSSTNVYTYDAKAQTFVAGGGGCAAPRSGTSSFTFGPATGAGLAQFELARAGAFIGITDAPDLVYRIISIDNQTMVLRAGRPTAGVVFTMKLRVKP
ncbi:PKD domain-containing protein [Hymenobacter lapidiphilus]|uniref:PKD domain-containing protein n=1 Tax=Hymenobacter lapidiphilus TaxID=2608003 RepID=A0A7Y7PLP6_9BACT|nr:PKD domain-containing protein [Hymenobacter lapidiphilus]NVO30109.1 PKD domain-containing protein [Hymenobacter lapidiphilus]